MVRMEHRLQISLNRYALSMEDKMATGAFWRATNYGWGVPFKWNFEVTWVISAAGTLIWFVIVFTVFRTRLRTCSRGMLTWKRLVLLWCWWNVAARHDSFCFCLVVLHVNMQLFRCAAHAFELNIPFCFLFLQLLPEFYQSSGEFLVNSQNLPLGCKQDKTKVMDVALPKWAKGA